jgi:hypothetical protein
MCEDVEDGVELALGQAPDDEGRVESPPDWLADLPDEPQSAEELAEHARADEERRQRVDAVPVALAARAFMRTAFRWLQQHPDAGRSKDEVVREAFEVAMHDHALIHVKLHRSLAGKEQHGTSDAESDDPVQNDWNGSAKVALLAIERSSEAWQVLASATSDHAAAALAAQLTDLRAEVERTFPDAWKFRRPGFDDTVIAG